MHEYVRQTQNIGTTYATATRPSNDNRRAPLAMGRSLFPQDAVARIDKPSRSVMTSGRVRTKGWRLTFERRAAPFIEPLMGWTGGGDTLTQIELNFPTRESAIRYAERQGLRYTVQCADAAADRKRRATGSAHAFSDATLKKLGLEELQESYGHAIDGSANRSDPSGPETWASPMEVVRDRALPLEAKRSILINWAWTEYLIDQATNEGMPENNRPSRLDEVEQALLALERQVADGRCAPLARNAA
ncbi:ETC complex I subunit [Mesorhizobium sp. CA8]|uniref:NADH dehydrogenase ubiquinone Fe-S protein 4 n=1 Tax=unclassified Mesorhizobium TaxID=325217 RepID=UPI001CCB350B|nr:MULTISPECIES: NADH dehydrogenase ubiquinone Fe-S protein 4 [unclassified Mesorhizobium]MBZ9764234.1 ETC complex I subunit [Mesorhizobium sp. CA8]MBZ9822836.1 ETC complex I subunit [Mesorhizobium sp. CA4]